MMLMGHVELVVPLAVFIMWFARPTPYEVSGVPMERFADE